MVDKNLLSEIHSVFKLESSWQWQQCTYFIMRIDSQAETTSILESGTSVATPTHQTSENCYNLVSNQIQFYFPRLLFECVFPLRRPLCVERSVNGPLYNAAWEIGGPVQVFSRGSKVMQLTCDNDCLALRDERLACTAVWKSLIHLSST